MIGYSVVLFIYITHLLFCRVPGDYHSFPCKVLAGISIVYLDLNAIDLFAQYLAQQEATFLLMDL